MIPNVSHPLATLLTLACNFFDTPPHLLSLVMQPFLQFSTFLTTQWSPRLQVQSNREAHGLAFDLRTKPRDDVLATRLLRTGHQIVCMDTDQEVLAIISRLFLLSFGHCSSILLSRSH